MSEGLKVNGRFKYSGYAPTHSRAHLSRFGENQPGFSASNPVSSVEAALVPESMARASRTLQAVVREFKTRRPTFSLAYDQRDSTERMAHETAVIMEATGREYGHPPDYLLTAHGRTQQEAEVSKVAIHLLIQSGLDLVQVARILSKDHCTVSHHLYRFPLPKDGQNTRLNLVQQLQMVPKRFPTFKDGFVPDYYRSQRPTSASWYVEYTQPVLDRIIDDFKLESTTVLTNKQARVKANWTEHQMAFKVAVYSLRRLGLGYSLIGHLLQRNPSDIYYHLNVELPIDVGLQVTEEVQKYEETGLIQPDRFQKRYHDRRLTRH